MQDLIHRDTFFKKHERKKNLGTKICNHLIIWVFLSNEI